MRVHHSPYPFPLLFPTPHPTISTLRIYFYFLPPQNVSEFWTIPLVLEELVDIVPELSVKKVFDLKNFDSE